MDYDPAFQLAHTGSGGMTSSLSIGTRGSTAVRRLRSFPLSPMLVTGRSEIKIFAKLEHTQFHNEHITKAGMRELVDSQWTGRSRPVVPREWIEEQLRDTRSSITR